MDYEKTNLLCDCVVSHSEHGHISWLYVYNFRMVLMHNTILRKPNTQDILQLCFVDKCSTNPWFVLHQIDRNNKRLVVTVFTLKLVAMLLCISNSSWELDSLAFGTVELGGVGIVELEALLNCTITKIVYFVRFVRWIMFSFLVCFCTTMSLHSFSSPSLPISKKKKLHKSLYDSSPILFL